MLHYVYCNNAVQQSKVNAMQKLTKAHARNIQLLALSTLQQYVATFVKLHTVCNDKNANITLLAADVSLIANTIHVFSLDGDVQQLYNTMHEVPGDFNSALLRYIEGNKLAVAQLL